jgi:hypothetical protein
MAGFWPFVDPPVAADPSALLNLSVPVNPRPVANPPAPFIPRPFKPHPVLADPLPVELPSVLADPCPAASPPAPEDAAPPIDPSAGFGCTPIRVFTATRGANDLLYSTVPAPSNNSPGTRNHQYKATTRLRTRGVTAISIFSQTDSDGTNSNSSILRCTAFSNFGSCIARFIFVSG